MMAADYSCLVLHARPHALQDVREPSQMTLLWSVISISGCKRASLDLDVWCIVISIRPVHSEVFIFLNLRKAFAFLCLFEAA